MPGTNYWLDLPYYLLRGRLEYDESAIYPPEELEKWKEAMIAKIQEQIEKYEGSHPGKRGNGCLGARTLFYYVCGDTLLHSAYSSNWNRANVEEQIDTVVRHAIGPYSSCDACKEILAILSHFPDF